MSEKKDKEVVPLESLSVGDWVCAEQLCGVHSEPKLTPPMRVVGLGDGVGGWVNLMIDREQGDPFEYEPSEIRGIKITSELLESNKFRRCIVEYNAWVCECCGDILLWMYKNLNDWTFVCRVYDEDGFVHERTLCEVKYVHELQHALRLAKVEKEIVV